MSTTTTHEHQARPLLGLRRQPGRIALAFMRLPRPLYRHGFGRLLGHTFLLIAHKGRKSGKRHETVAMPLTYDAETREAVVCSAWGPDTDWIRNLRAHPALEIQIGAERYVPKQRLLSEEEAVAVGLEFRRKHPWRLRLFAAILGWGDLGSDEAVRELVRGRPFVVFRPASEGPRGRSPERSSPVPRPKASAATTESTSSAVRGERMEERSMRETKPGETPPRDLALLAVAVVLMLGGAVTLVGGWIAAAIAIPVIAVGIALVVIERRDVHRQEAKHIPDT
jgi:deazaflavin-dependent oxidoreductase (nitroreductase family)